MKQSRPNYILELKDRTIKFVPHPNYDDIWIGLSRRWTEPELEKKLGATPVPQEELKLVYRLTFADDRCEWRTRSDCIPFKSHEDAENYRLRCESIGPPWTDWEPEDGQKVWSCLACMGFDTNRYSGNRVLDRLFATVGIYQPTEERRDEWLDRFGKAWGLM